MCKGESGDEASLSVCYVSALHLIQVNIEYVPILLGALFKEIGTPMVIHSHLCISIHVPHCLRTI